MLNRESRLNHLQHDCDKIMNDKDTELGLELVVISEGLIILSHKGFQVKEFTKQDSVWDMRAEIDKYISEKITKTWGIDFSCVPCSGCGILRGRV